MPKLFRRSWEKQKFGRAGAISSPLPLRQGTDGVISSAAFATPVKVLTSATAAFVSGDVGRKILLEGTPSNRYDGWYIIDSINSGMSVNLRCNHNVVGTPTSDARFFENGTTITWIIPQSCIFTADAAGDIRDHFAGSYLTISGATNNLENNGQWWISHRLSSSQVILTKSWFWTIVDHTSFSTYKRIDNYDFVAETSLQWFVADREAIHSMDMYEIWQQALIDSGWTLCQQRGHNATLLSLRDNVYRSLGEDNTFIPGGKQMFLRSMWYGTNRTLPGVFSTSYIDNAIFQHWDVTQTATAPGNGSAGFVASSVTAGPAATPSTTGTNGSATLSPQSNPDFISASTQGFPFVQHRIGYSIFNDRDEINVSLYLPSGGGTQQQTISWLKPVTTNPNVLTVTAPVAAGSNVQVNVGTVDAQTLSPPYAVGDNVTLVGYRTATTTEYIQTATIVSFNNADVNNRRIVVDTLNIGFGNGPDTLKAQIGEDVFPVAVAGTTSATPFNYARAHNASRFGNATGRDYDTTNRGIAATPTGVASLALAEIDPNRKSGRWGLYSTYVRITTNGETRGRFRNIWSLSSRLSFGTKVLNRTNDAYVIVYDQSTTTAIAYGPMTKAMANVD